jgi:purine-nucleoside phosphorylase
MSHWISRVKETTEFLRKKGFEHSKTAIIIGTGLKKLVERMDIIHEMSYAEDSPLPGFNS